MIVTLAWPPRALWPNHRAHWSATSRAKRSYRRDAFYLARDNVDSLAPTVALIFHPPDNRARDLDNMIAAMKAGLDGIADAIGIDDSKWKLTAQKGDVVPNGCVIVTVTP